ncbi:MAG: protein tyrosine phosphatase family protein [Pseudomonadota bacterium]
MDLPHILNWRRMTPQITTSGQPSEAELAELKALGVERIVNLGPHDNDGALPDEPGSVARLGMAYDYIPVDFEAPTDADFEAFRQVLEDHPDEMIHVHCIYNARVSAFFYRLAAAGGGLGLPKAASNLESIWRPGEDWVEFTGIEAAKGQPNRYKGEDY